VASWAGRAGGTFVPGRPRYDSPLIYFAPPRLSFFAFSCSLPSAGRAGEGGCFWPNAPSLEGREQDKGKIWALRSEMRELDKGKDEPSTPTGGGRTWVSRTQK